MTKHLLKNVFGIRSHQIESYTERTAVDGAFAEALESDHHIVVYGSSKQGKTSLRERHLDSGKCVIFRCGPRTEISGIYMSILRQEKVRIVSHETRTFSGKAGGKGQLTYSAKLPLLSSSMGGEVSGEFGAALERYSEYVPFDLGEAQSVGELLQEMKFRKFIVLENFHYLARDVQRDLARDLKTFHEIGVRFIILGIWREANMLMIHNPDLQDRVTEIPVEPWHADDFDKVIDVGCTYLNISIGRDILARFKFEAFGNVGMLQEFLKIYCEVHGVTETQTLRLEMVSNVQATEVFDRKLTDQKTQFINCLGTIAGKSRTDHKDPLLLPYYLVRVLCTLKLDEIRDGIHKHKLLECIREMHHREHKDTIRGNDITHLLNSLQQLQVDLGTPFLYYDANMRRLRLVDTRHFFVLNRANRDELLGEIPFPVDEIARRGSAQISIRETADDYTHSLGEGRGVLGEVRPTRRGYDSDKKSDEDWNREVDDDDDQTSASECD